MPVARIFLQEIPHAPFKGLKARCKPVKPEEADPQWDQGE
jgi:hypothetical protein